MTYTIACQACHWTCTLTLREKAIWNIQFHEKEVHCGPVLLTEDS